MMTIVGGYFAGLDPRRDGRQHDDSHERRPVRREAAGRAEERAGREQHDGRVLARRLRRQRVQLDQGHVLVHEQLVDAGHDLGQLADLLHGQPHREADLAALRVDVRDLPAVPLGDSRKLKPGDVVLARKDAPASAVYLRNGQTYEAGERLVSSGRSPEGP